MKVINTSRKPARAELLVLQKHSREVVSTRLSDWRIDSTGPAHQGPSWSWPTAQEETPHRPDRSIHLWVAKRLGQRGTARTRKILAFQNLYPPEILHGLKAPEPREKTLEEGEVMAGACQTTYPTPPSPCPPLLPPFESPRACFPAEV